MADYPEGVVPTDPAVEMLINIIRESYIELGKQMLDKRIMDTTRQRAIIRQVEELAAKVDRDVNNWIRYAIPSYYEMGLYSATEELHKRGSKVRIVPSMAQVHLRAVEAISRETSAYMSEALRGITLTGERIVALAEQRKINELIGKGIITGKGEKGLAAEIKAYLQENGIGAMRDRRGVEWQLDRYTRMLARTKLTQAHNAGIINRMQEAGYDLVLITQHMGSCKLCAPHQGKVFSLNGRTEEFPSLQSAISSGLFHPNCRHTMTPYFAEYLDQAKVWDQEKQKYVPFNERTILTADVPKTKSGKTGVFKAKTLEFNMNEYENALAKKHGLEYTTKTDRTTFGYYQTGTIGGKTFNYISINENNLKKHKQNPDHTFYHEFGHFIDRRTTTYYLSDTIEFREALKDVVDTMVKTRLTTGGASLDYYDELKSIIETRRLPDGSRPSRKQLKNARYYFSASENFAEAYAYYRTNPEKLKEMAPEVYKFLNKLYALY